MFDRTHAFAAGTHYLDEVARLARDPSLADSGEVELLCVQAFLVFAALTMLRRTSMDVPGRDLTQDGSHPSVWVRKRTQNVFELMMGIGKWLRHFE